MAGFVIESVPARLAGNTYNLDEEESHIEVDQELARRLGDGTIGVEYAAGLECGTCLAMAPKGVLKWHYPRGSFGIMFREG